MKLKEHNILLEEIFQKVTDIRLAGQREYAHDEDNCFANFERIANLQELNREQVLMTYLLKHIDGIQSYVKGHHSQREDVTGRIVDVIVYLTLLWGMVEQDRKDSEWRKNEEDLDRELTIVQKHGIRSMAKTIVSGTDPIHEAEEKDKFKPEWKQEPDRFKVKGYDSNGNKIKTND